MLTEVNKNECFFWSNLYQINKIVLYNLLSVVYIILFNLLN